nr:immunoglobulin heavy chain junction region [Macaca mulatta]
CAKDGGYSYSYGFGGEWYFDYW